MGSTAKAIALNVLLHLLFFGGVWMLLYLPTTTEALTQSYRDDHQDMSAQQGQLNAALGAIAWWAFWALVIGLVLSSFWLAIIAQRAQVRRVQQTSRYTGSWAIGLLVSLAIAGGIYALSTTDLLGFLESQVRLYGLISGLIAVILAYWLGTGLFVKPAVQSAVPFATFLPSIGAR